jgi:DNA modification methylase
VSTFEVMHGDCRTVMELFMDENSVDAIVTDPPYGLGFMGKEWDHGVPGVAFWTEALRVLKPGGHLLAFSGSRTYHRMVCAIEDAGFEIRDQIMWLYGSGFPKSLDVSKALDKSRTEDAAPVRVVCRYLRAAMDAKGLKSKDMTQHFGGCNARLIDHWAARDSDSQPSLPTWPQWETLREVLGLPGDLDAEVWRLNGRKGTPGEAWQNAEVTGIAENAMSGWSMDGTTKFADRELKGPNSDAARQWEGWGTALKPAHEPIVVARKPLIGTVAANVLAHGTGAINVDGCRVENPDYDPNAVQRCQTKQGGHTVTLNVPGHEQATYNAAGRWPANVIHDGSDEVVAQFGEPARFFYCAKASKADRNEGCEGLEERTGGMVSNTSGQHITRRDGGAPGPRANHHPTVKPTALMRYLCRLVTPPGGTVLDPFTGSGSTGKAAVLEGFSFIGIENEEDYCAIANARIEAVRRLTP